MFHSDCRGEFSAPEQILVHFAMSPDHPLMGIIQQMLGLGEDAKMAINGPAQLLTESLPKSVRERIHRRTRKVSEDEGSDPIPVIKKDADNDPRKTSKGRASLRGNRKKARDRKMSRPDWHQESVEFAKSVGGPMDQIIESAGKLKNPFFTLRLLERLGTVPDAQIEAIQSAKRAIVTVLEGKGYTSGIFAGKLGDKSEAVALEMAESELARIVPFLVESWIERTEDKRSNLVRYVVIGESKRGERYARALGSGYVQQR